ncbi:MAG: hypothetical protein ACRC5M_06670 [Anaeroplasmataceae bacterium]
MKFLKNTKQILEFKNECKKRRSESLLIERKYGKGVILEIGDFLIFKNKKYLYIGIIRDKEDIPKDLDCLYVFNEMASVRNCKVNNVNKWLKELELNKKKYMYKEYERDPVRYYYRKKQGYNKVIKEIEKRKDNKYRYISDLKESLGGKCNYCNEEDNDKLTFERMVNHTPYNVSKMINRCSKKDIERQVMNCRLICKECRIKQMMKK